MVASYKSLYFLSLLIIFVSSQLNSTSRQCQEIYDQKIDQKIMKMSYKAAVFSSMAYLEYEKKMEKYPWKIDFETTDKKSTQNNVRKNLKLALQCKMCQLKIITRKTGIFLMNVLLSPFVSGQSSHERGKKDVMKYKECSLEDDHPEKFILRWFFADWKEGGCIFLYCNNDCDIDIY